MSDLENAVIDIANMQADELFEERVHAVLCKALEFDRNQVPNLFSSTLISTIRVVIRQELAMNAQTQNAQQKSGLVGGNYQVSGLVGGNYPVSGLISQQQGYYQASNTASPFQQAFNEIDSLFK